MRENILILNMGNLFLFDDLLFKNLIALICLGHRDEESHGDSLKHGVIALRAGSFDGS
jgi:hypothetical protein